MKKIMTAIGDEKLNQRLKQESDLEIVANDIPYKEGIIEVLEKQQVDFLILSELLQGEMDLKELIEKIKAINLEIHIILFLEKPNQELENYLYAKGIYSIFYDNQIEIIEIIRIIKEDKQDENKQLKQELEQLKQLVIEKKSNSEKIKDFLKKRNQKKLPAKATSEESKQGQVICVSGTSRCGEKYF